jgi:hypothetical protein
VRAIKIRFDQENDHQNYALRRIQPARYRWLMLVILPTWLAEIGRIEVPNKNLCKTSYQWKKIRVLWCAPQQKA